MRVLLAITLLAACRPDAVQPKLDPTADILAKYAEASDRLVSMLDAGWVVSWQETAPEHLGDSLIWSGIALASLSCEKGAAIESALIDMLTVHVGHLQRHPNVSGLSLDGLLGFYRGVAYRVKHCGSGSIWEAPLVLHAAAPTPELVPEFTYVRDLLLADTTDSPRPSHDRLKALETEVTLWAIGVVTDKSACFRLNLGYQALRTVEELGEAVDKGHFCAATQAVRLATVDHWCGRAGLAEWVEGFKYDAWEYRHQRCPEWEAPDGRPGLHTPGLDLVELLKDGYDL